MSSRRLKASIIVAGLVLSGLTIIAWTGEWFTLFLAPGEGAKASVAVSGEVAAGGLSALGLAGLALVGALSIAGPVFRAILGVLEVLIGFTVTLSALTALASPVTAGAAAVTAATAVSGSDSISALVTGSESTGWPVIGAVLGVLTTVVGVAILSTGRRWPRATRKYQTAGFVPAEKTDAVDASEIPDTGSDSAARWDALSDGSDPTSR